MYLPSASEPPTIPLPVKVRVTTVWSFTTSEEATTPTVAPSSRVSPNASLPIVTTPLNVNVRCVTIDRWASPSLTRNDDTVAGSVADVLHREGEVPTLFARLASS